MSFDVIYAHVIATFPSAQPNTVAAYLQEMMLEIATSGIPEIIVISTGGAAVDIPQRVINIHGVYVNNRSVPMTMTPEEIITGAQGRERKCGIGADGGKLHFSWEVNEDIIIRTTSRGKIELPHDITTVHEKYTVAAIRWAMYRFALDTADQRSVAFYNQYLLQMSQLSPSRIMAKSQSIGTSL